MPWKETPVAICIECGEFKPVAAKGMCRRCYGRLWARVNRGKKPSTVANAERNARLIAEGRAAILEAKNVPCMDCGESYPPYVMEFEHRPDEVKLFALSNAAARKLDTILAEIAKCDVVCANCHRIRTHKRGQHLVGLAAANTAIQARMMGKVM